MQIIGLLQGKNLIVSLAKKSIRTWHTAPSASLISAIKFLITHRKPEFASVLVDFPGFARHQKALKSNLKRGVCEWQSLQRRDPKRSSLTGN